MATLDDILNIDKKNEFLKYIIERLKRYDYRGFHISQHNRYDLNYVLLLINSIYEVVGNKKFKIPPGDYSEKSGKKDYDINDYPEFKLIVEKISARTGKGTYNSVKKNFFVDLDRMGLLEREMNKSLGYLTDEAIELLKLYKNNEKRKLIKKFTDIIDENLFGDFLSNLVEFMDIYGYAKVDIYEYTFILNDPNLTDDKKDSLLRSYRMLKSKNKLIDLIKSYANPDNFDGDKSDKRDFHNWLNESMQVFSLLKFTTYFEVIKENNIYKLLLNTTNSTGIFTVNLLQRSSSIKNDYFSTHKVNKMINFELHHIVPIKVALNYKDMNNIDNVYNLIYIHKNAHKYIHKNRLYQLGEITNTYIEFKNCKDGRCVKYYNQKELLYNPSYLRYLSDYNKKLFSLYKNQICLIS